MDNKENYNNLMDQMEKLLTKLCELDFMFDRSNIKIQMSEKTKYLISLQLEKHILYKAPEGYIFTILGFKIEEDNNLKDWEVNVKFQDTYITNPDGTTTRITNYINLNNIDKLEYVPSWINCSRTIL